MSVQTLRCQKHRITMTVDAENGKRKWSVDRERGSGGTLCALLLADNPQAGRLPIVDPGTGQKTALYCDVEEVG